MTRNFEFGAKFDREGVVPALKSFFSLKGMTLSSQKLFMKKFWDGNSNFEPRICTARSGGASTYVSEKMTRNFEFGEKFDREGVVPALKSFFYPKGMTLSFQELFMKKFWDGNSNFETRICTARSGGDSTYVSKKRTQNFEFGAKFDREGVVPDLKSFFSLKGMTLSSQKLFMKKFWDQNSNFEPRICTARSGGDSTYVST